MERDSLREYLLKAVEAYNIAATPIASPVFRESLDDVIPLASDRMTTDNRRTLLDLSIDVKRIYEAFMEDIGPVRGDRFTTWVKVGYAEQFHSDHRMQLKNDRRTLSRRISAYRGPPGATRHTKPPEIGVSLYRGHVE